MIDRFSDTGHYNEIKFSREQGFFDKSSTIRFLIGLFFSVCLFLFLHFREIHVEVLELNSVAPKYIVSQVDFDFFDEEATIILKQEALRDVGKVYFINEKEIRQRRQEIDHYLLYNQELRKKIENVPLEEMYRGIGLIEKGLMLVRFSDPRTIQKLGEIEVPTADFLIYSPESLKEKINIPPFVWNHIQSYMATQGEVNPDTTQFLMDYFKEKKWMVEEDILLERAIHKKIQGTVADKYTRINAGDRIIDQGEKVTSRHIAMLQAMKNALKEERHLFYPITFLGSAIMTALLTYICIAFLRSNHPQVYASNRKLFLLTTITILTLLLAKGVEYVILNASNNLMEIVRYPLLVPFAAILLCSLMNPSIATFASGFLTLVLAMTLAFDQHGFIVTNIGAAIIAILSARSLRHRKEIFVICGKAWLVCATVIFSMNFYYDTLNSPTLLADLFSSLFFMIFTAVLVVGLLPLLESMFHIMTDVTLMEYMDPNHELLRRLAFEAPGTYQHSVVMGSIAETAALAIGANGLFCRVSALYHDIGKMATPQYFTENQQGGMNIHQLLTPLESAHVIIAHVSEGVAMARKAGLPEQFIDIIKEHHGTTLVYYFYRKQLELLGGDRELVDEKEFRYFGPKPRSKESAIMMIADSLEAASRSLDRIDRESVTELIERLIREKAEDGQFDECLLTFEELGIVKKAMVKILVAASHSRIKYPPREKPKTKIAHFEIHQELVL